MTFSPKPSLSGPLYLQIHDVLRSRIVAGEWNAREPLPGEAALSQEFGVSVGTVRKAMDQLMRDNIVVRERGRGTFVRDGTEWRSSCMFRLRRNDGVQALAEISIVDQHLEFAGATSDRLIKPHGRPWSKLRLLNLFREWRIAGALVCREKITVEEGRFPGLLDAKGLNSETLFDLYAEDYRFKVENIRWQIGGDLAVCKIREPWTEELAAPTLSVTRIALDNRGAPIEVCEQFVSLAHCIVDIVS